MAYQSTIPQPTDRLRTSQGDLLGNFAATSGGLGTMLNPNQGYIQFPNQGATPTPTLTQPGLYGSTPALTNVEELFIAKNVAGPSFIQVPMTASTLSLNANPVRGNSCFAYLPSGFIIQWGSFSGASTNTPVNFAIPFPTRPLTVVCSLNSTSANLTAVLYVSNFVPASFNINFTGGATVAADYIAIGF